MKASLIKGRIRGDSNKCYNWYNKRIKLGLQIYKVLHIPELLREYVFKKKYSRLYIEREIYH